MRISCLFLPMTSCIITGGIGCGKSFVATRFQALLNLGVAVFSSDESARAVVAEKVVCREIVACFGTEVLLDPSDGESFSRSKLRELIFRDSDARKKLEKIVHPLVLRDLDVSRQGARLSGAELFLAEVPLHYEIGVTIEADLVIVVAASQSVQARRLMERRGLDSAIIEHILRSQWPIEAKVERADRVIWNDGDLAALETQVLTLARQFRQA